MPDQCCRICFEGNNSGDDASEKLLESPCKCSGSMALLHASCLETWLTTSRREKCEICQSSFETIRVFPTFREYIRDPRNRVTFQLIAFIAELLSFLLPTLVLWIMTYQWYTDRKHSNRLLFDGWEAIALVVGSFALLSACIIWGRGSFRHHQYKWSSWRMSHQQIRLVLSKTSKADFPDDHEAQIV